MAKWREETIGDCRLILGDCREVQGSLQYDAVIADPPYGISHKRGKCGDRGKGVATIGTTGILGDDSAFDPSPFLSKPCLLWGANNFAGALPAGAWLVWDKTVGGGAGDFSQAEIAWLSKPGATRVFRHLWMGVQRASEVGQSRLHPTQKPVALLEWCIGFFPNAATIFDPFMGSAPTAIAAIRNGRRFVGCELDPHHFSTACRRIETAYSQPDIFIEAERREAVQEPLFGGEAA